MGRCAAAQQTYALLDERAPRSADCRRRRRRSWRAGSSRATARQAFPDLARWSSLTISQCRDALDAVKDRLECVTVEGVEIWFGPEAPQRVGRRDALLLPLYDELTLSYPMINFPQATGHPHTPGEDLFVGCVIIAETNVGTWRRTVKGRKMIMEIALAPELVPGSGRAG